jgi:hypothetical protein
VQQARWAEDHVSQEAGQDYRREDAGMVTYARVILFRESGKYYTEEEWRIPEGAIGPHDMTRSPDFRRIGTGPVLVDTQEPWGYPWLSLS